MIEQKEPQIYNSKYTFDGVQIVSYGKVERQISLNLLYDLFEKGIVKPKVIIGGTNAPNTDISGLPISAITASEIQRDVIDTDSKRRTQVEGYIEYRPHGTYWDIITRKYIPKIPSRRQSESLESRGETIFALRSMIDNGWKNMLVISHPIHLPRVLLLYRQLGARATDNIEDITSRKANILIIPSMEKVEDTKDNRNFRRGEFFKLLLTYIDSGVLLKLLAERMPNKLKVGLVDSRER